MLVCIDFFIFQEAQKGEALRSCTRRFVGVFWTEDPVQIQQGAGGQDGARL